MRSRRIRQFADVGIFSVTTSASSSVGRDSHAKRLPHELALVVTDRSSTAAITRIGVLLFASLAISCAEQTKTSARPTVAKQTSVKLTDPQPAHASAVSNTDPCATRMHDISGAMLLYYATHARLPAKLDDLRTTPGGDSLEPFASPATGKPFLYNAVGVVDPKRAAQRVVLYEAEPSSGGFRWAITIVEAGADAPLVARVVAIPESEFAFMGR